MREEAWKCCDIAKIEIGRPLRVLSSVVLSREVEWAQEHVLKGGLGA